MLRCLTVVALLFQISLWGMQVHVSGPDCKELKKVCCCDASGSEPTPWQTGNSCDGCLSCLAHKDQDGAGIWPDLGISQSGVCSGAAVPAANVVAIKSFSHTRTVSLEYAVRPPETGPPSQAVLSRWLN